MAVILRRVQLIRKRTVDKCLSSRRRCDFPIAGRSLPASTIRPERQGEGE